MKVIQREKKKQGRFSFCNVSERLTAEIKLKFHVYYIQIHATFILCEKDLRFFFFTQNFLPAKLSPRKVIKKRSQMEETSKRFD